jgi:hypothetical protein
VTWCLNGQNTEYSRQSKIEGPLAENVWRAPLRSEEFREQLPEWHAIYLKQHPSTRPGAAGLKAIQERARVRDGGKAHEAPQGGEAGKGSQAIEKPDGGGEPTYTAPAEDAKPVGTQSFADHLAEKMGVSRGTVHRVMRLAKAFTEEQAAILSRAEVPDYRRARLLTVKDADQRDRAIRLIDEGVEVEDAIAAATGKPIDARTEQKMTDQVWLTRIDGVRAKLAPDQQARFDRDAISHRRTKELREKLREAAGKVHPKSRDQDPGPFLAAMVGFLDIPDPSQWSLCGECSGSGATGEASSCPKCSGAGYQAGPEAKDGRESKGGLKLVS